MNGTLTHQDGRLMLIYSNHSTRDRAENALEDYFADGEVSEGERPMIRNIKGRFCVLFPAE